MKSVLISIHPKWCEKIINGEKTFEIRKTKPKLKTPFKVYIYETQGRTEIPFIDEDGHMIFKGRGQIIGEFICKKIIPLKIFTSDIQMVPVEMPNTCLTDVEIVNYLGNGVIGYGWHISNLKIYDVPKKLREFGKEKAPQSWCYVEDFKNE